MNRLLIIVGVWAVLGMCNQAVVGGTLRIVRSIDHPMPSEAGMDMAWDGQHLWTLTTRGRHVLPGEPTAVMHELDPSDGSIVSWSDMGDPNNRGLTWDGTTLWNTHHVSWGGGREPGSPPDVAPDLMENRSTDGTIISSFELPHSPDAWPQGAAWDGEYLWISDYKHRDITRVDPADGSVLTWFPSPGPEPRGLAWDGTSLWSVDGADNVIYQMDAFGNVLETWSAPLTDPYGITFDGEYLWVLDLGLENFPMRIYQLAIPEPPGLSLSAIGVVIILGFVWRRRNPPG